MVPNHLKQFQNISSKENCEKNQSVTTGRFSTVGLELQKSKDKIKC